MVILEIKLERTKMSTNSKIIKNITMPTIIIIVCFVLGFLDMMFLRESIATLAGQGPEESGIIALAIATVANFSALLWGQGKGEGGEDKKIGRIKARSSFWTWVGIGFIYLAFRISALSVSIVDGAEIINIIGEIVNMILLAILYISTGTTISAKAREIFDAGARACRLAKKKFTEADKKLLKKIHKLNVTMGALESYQNNYDYLNIQVAEQSKTIAKFENATMADAESQMLHQHVDIDAVDLHKVKEQVLKANA